MKNDYLWDGSVEPDESDAYIRDIEMLLGRYRYAAPMPDFRRVVVHRRRRRWPLAVAAAAIIAVIVGSMFLLRPPPGEWKVTAVAGASSLPDRPLRVGDVLRTDSKSRIRLEARSVGVIDVDGTSTIRLIESRKGRQRIALDVGVIHARTTSPPGVFVVDTPQARAIDLGCEYVLSIAPGGSGELRVTSGWVELSDGFWQSLVPQ
jgi:ferric-dicitrate binding protein FerR (iron transport regulator)